MWSRIRILGFKTPVWTCRSLSPWAIPSTSVGPSSLICKVVCLIDSNEIAQARKYLVPIKHLISRGCYCHYDQILHMPPKTISSLCDLSLRPSTKVCRPLNVVYEHLTQDVFIINVSYTQKPSCLLVTNWLNLGECFLFSVDQNKPIVITLCSNQIYPLNYAAGVWEHLISWPSEHCSRHLHPPGHGALAEKQ